MSYAQYLMETYFPEDAWDHIKSFADMENHVKNFEEPRKAQQNVEFQHYKENPNADRPSTVPSNATRRDLPGYGHQWQWVEDGVVKYHNVRDPNASYRRRKDETLASYLLQLFEQASVPVAYA